MRGWFYRITNGLARAAALAGLFSLVLTVVGQLLATLWWPLELASHFVPYYAAALGVAIPVLLRHPRQRRPRLAGLCLLAFTWNAVLLWPCFAPSFVGSSNAFTLRVLSINVHNANTQYERVLDMVRHADADVVALYEVTPRWINAMRPLEELYANRKSVSREDSFGILIYSRLPTESISMVELGGSLVPSAELRATVAGRPLVLLANHPLPPSSADYAADRNRQLRGIAAWAREQSAPVIVMGDLNITRWSPYFRALLRDSGLEDSSRGRGLQNTWRPRPWLPGIPIDHVLHSPSLEVLDRQVGPDVGSDHLPVLVDFAPKRAS